ncbi:PREDICTED: probable inactive histone-lysine N-methyltransferase SUVR2 isoform X2 [Nelumbo nucifera]|uniref:Probable inactive histone-lysine N-methyltransferase SUVR2 isoform X2 n=1 Tax=Nelumbo nucifera TaxID=4432 RepID=A0A1U8AJK8_NELNU|nr:PREDICTED: probable inactive histone-lysine N-methyltransferase SUVR2 isoform X2 [Nelumbo nucifera]
MSRKGPNPRVAKALSAMEALGISEDTVRPVLRNLLKLYERKWELIEEENYRALADAIFEYEETQAAERTIKRVENIETTDDVRTEYLLHDDSEHPHKRLCLRRHASSSIVISGLALGENSSRKAKSGTASDQSCSTQEKEESSQGDERSESKYVSPETHLRDRRKERALPQPCPQQEEAETCPQFLRNRRTESDAVTPRIHHRDKGKELLSIQISPREKRSLSLAVCLKESNIEPGNVLLPKEKPNSHCYNALMKPKSEPFTDELPQFELPLAMICPPEQGLMKNKAIPDPVNRGSYSVGVGSTKADGREPVLSKNVEEKGRNDGVGNIAFKSGSNFEPPNLQEESLANFEIASSPLGEVKISLSYRSDLGRSDFHMPNLDMVLKMVEDKCRKSYRIAEPDFSLMKLMKELCLCFLEQGTDSSGDKQERLTNMLPKLGSLQNSDSRKGFGSKYNNLSNFHMPESSSNGSTNLHSSIRVPVSQKPRLLGLNGLESYWNVAWSSSDKRNKKKKEVKGPESSNSRSVVVVQQRKISFDDVKPLHDVNDISKGEEKVRISVANEISDEQYPPTFYYIPKNIVYQHGYVNFSLARIADEDCCSSCFGDCLSSSIPCACARETGGEFAYNREGLVKKEFLDEVISMNRDPQQHRLFYCKDCPLERSKNEDIPDTCKGHLVRRFIKECWSKCGCSKQCGNRVVQRGITCNLQVFLTSEEKGWGLRTLKGLPRGAFVCEYIGEILTNMELYERNTQSTRNKRHTYPVLLDADWGSEGVLKDEEALCLDATYYGNVARFINHRCFDANLVEIPVEVETPDHHYYHLAFFTTRKVDAMEELTWDYGIDFADDDHPVKAFCCCCGSKFCRDIKRPNRTRSRSLILR